MAAGTGPAGLSLSIPSLSSSPPPPLSSPVHAERPVSASGGYVSLRPQPTGVVYDEWVEYRTFDGKIFYHSQHTGRAEWHRPYRYASASPRHLGGMSMASQQHTLMAQAVPARNSAASATNYSY